MKKEKTITKMQIDDTNERPASGAGKLYSAGCLPLLVAWFLLDLIGKSIICGIASLFGKPMPTLAIVIKWTAYSIFTPLGAIFIATLIWILYAFISERIGNFFRKGSKDKGRPSDAEQKSLPEECNEQTSK